MEFTEPPLIVLCHLAVLIFATLYITLCMVWIKFNSVIHELRTIREILDESLPGEGEDEEEEKASDLD